MKFFSILMNQEPSIYHLLAIGLIVGLFSYYFIIKKYYKRIKIGYYSETKGKTKALIQIIYIPFYIVICMDFFRAVTLIPKSELYMVAFFLVAFSSLLMRFRIKEIIWLIRLSKKEKEKIKAGVYGTNKHEIFLHKVNYYSCWSIIKLFYWVFILMLYIVVATRTLWVGLYPEDLQQLFVWVLIYSTAFMIVDWISNPTYYGRMRVYYGYL